MSCFSARMALQSTPLYTLAEGEDCNGKDVVWRPGLEVVRGTLELSVE